LSTATDPAAPFLLNSAQAHVLGGNQFRARGQGQAAVANYEQALRLCPDDLDAHVNLGVALAEQGRLDEAIARWRQALALRPGYAVAHNNLGVALTQQGKAEEARASLEEALRLQPGYAEAAYNLGVLLMQQGRRPEAVARFEEALRLQPDHAQAYNNLGLLLAESGRPAEAVVMLSQAVRLRPAFVQALNNLGVAYAAYGKPALAEASYQEALRRDPKCAEAHANLGKLCSDQGRHDEGLACYQLAVWLKADPTARWHLALALLAQGDFARGWPEYECRWQLHELPPRPFVRPRWDGSPLDGRTILLYREQGLGDTLQFIRYAALVKERGGTVIVECLNSLLPLLRRCVGIDRLVAEGTDLPAFDVQAPLMSLPLLCGTTPATIPAQVPYLFPDPDAVEHWRRQLGPVRAFKIGIVWQGNPEYANDRYRSFPLTAFEPLARMPGVRLYSLQKGAGTEQLRTLAGRFEVVELVPELDAAAGAFLETAAVMKNLDLVIAPDTAVAHLAGALGVPAWVALMADADWRWLRGREDSPWYPTLRLFRQGQQGAWAPVFQRMAAELPRLLAARTGPLAPDRQLP
jgi:Flp pilus assembly protein TadD